jgi:hypothetical protein
MAKIQARSKLGDYFVAFRLVKRSDIETCAKSMLPGQMLGHVLVKQGVVHDWQLCEKVAKVRRLYLETAPKLKQRGIEVVLDQKSFIGDILVALGSITPEEKEHWLQYQLDERAKGNAVPRLGELLVDEKVCSKDARDLGMEVQDWLRGAK